MTEKKTKRVRASEERGLRAAEILEEGMTKDEFVLRDEINKMLARNGFHLRLTMVKLDAENGIQYSYMPPIDQWFEELKTVESIVVKVLTDRFDEINRNET